jgi:hypothetical protein
MLGLNAPRPLQIIESPALKDTSLNRIERAVAGPVAPDRTSDADPRPIDPALNCRSFLVIAGARRDPFMSQCACAAD